MKATKHLVITGMSLVKGLSSFQAAPPGGIITRASEDGKMMTARIVMPGTDLGLVEETRREDVSDNTVRNSRVEGTMTTAENGTATEKVGLTARGATTRTRKRGGGARKNESESL